MFSVVMAGNDSAWNVPVGEVHNDTFTLSRFLEYTDPSIVASFQPITATSLAYLSELPTLFMSELDRDDNRNEFFRIRLGKVSNLSVVAGEIFYTFELSHDFGEVPVTDREAFRKALRMDSFELHRTHWAIKSADLSTVLNDIIPGCRILPTSRRRRPHLSPPRSRASQLRRCKPLWRGCSRLMRSPARRYFIADIRTSTICSLPLCFAGISLAATNTFRKKR